MSGCEERITIGKVPYKCRDGCSPGIVHTAKIAAYAVVHWVSDKDAERFRKTGQVGDKPLSPIQKKTGAKYDHYIEQAKAAIR